jgi:hypothetical protein
LAESACVEDGLHGRYKLVRYGRGTGEWSGGHTVTLG